MFTMIVPSMRPWWPVRGHSDRIPAYLGKIPLGTFHTTSLRLAVNAEDAMTHHDIYALWGSVGKKMLICRCLVYSR